MKSGYGELVWEYKRQRLEIVNLRNELRHYKEIAERVSKQISTLKDERKDFIFIGNTNCEYYRRINDDIAMLEKIYYYL